MRKITLLVLAALLVFVAAHAFAQEDTQEEIAQFTGIIGKRMDVYKWADDQSLKLGKIEKDVVVDVYNKGRTWTRIAYGDGQGYVLTKFVERVQRKNPFDGPMPGTSKHVAVACVLKDTSFKPEGYNYPIEVSAGTWLSIEEIRDGRAYFPYKREPENVSLSTKNMTIYDFVPWEEAKPGELLSALTAFSAPRLERGLKRARVSRSMRFAARIRRRKVTALRPSFRAKARWDMEAAYARFVQRCITSCCAYRCGLKR